MHPPFSQSPTVSSISSSSLRSSPSALHFPSGGSGRPRDRYKSPARPHSHTPTTFLSQDSLLLTSTPASAGYIVTQPVSSGIVRPLAQVPSRPSKKRGALVGTGIDMLFFLRTVMYGSPQYAHIPTGSTFMATPQVSVCVLYSRLCGSCIPTVVLQVDPGCSGFYLQPFSQAFLAVQFTVHHNWMEGRVGNKTRKLVQWLFQCLPQVVSPKFDHLSAQPQMIGEPVNTW